MAKVYQAYPEYKDSGVEWLGVIPKDWSVTRIKFFSELNPSKNKLRNLPVDMEVTFLPMEAIGEQGELDTSRTKLLEEVISGYTYLEEGDVCIAKITPCFENGKGAVLKQLSNKIGFATTEVIPLRCNSPEDRKFLYYLLTSSPFNKQAEGSMYGAGGQKRVSDNFVANYHFALPKPIERPKIAHFLDHETAKIDALIEKQQQLIALLKEKRQAVISHAVTKGLNPNVKMKDSGVEWLGDVPEGWAVAGFTKYLATIVDYRGKTPEKTEDGVFLVTARNIKNGRIDYNLSQEFISELDYRLILQRGVPKLGEILFTTEAPLGEVARVDRVDIALAQRVIKFNGIKNVLDNTFLMYFIMSTQFQNSLILFASGSTAIGIKAERFTYLRFLLPPFNEQSLITNFIENKTRQMDFLIKKAQYQIQLLQERRTALISAAVTGKIDLRDWQAA